MSRALRMLLTAIALVTLAGSALAQQPADIERAKASFKAGANAYAAGDYLAAIQALETAYEISPLPAIAFSLAQAERKQFAFDQQREHLERSLQLFHRYLEQEPRGARREDALSAIALLEPLLGNKPLHSEPSKPQQRPTRVMIVSEAPGALITLDGAQPAASPLIREVAPGKHRAKISASGYFEVERDVTAVAGELLLTEVELAERPSSLHVFAPAGSDIYIDGVFVGRGGPRLTVALPTGRHQLAVGQKGRRLVRRDLEGARGRTNSEVVRLEPTMQRNLSELLFIGGGAALGAGVALTAFAVRSENRAEDYLRRRDHVVTQPAELVAYNASLVERSRYRTAATVSLAGSVGMFITGLFLHELDRPSLTASPQPDVARERDRIGKLVFAPTAAAADVGASLQLNF